MNTAAAPNRYPLLDGLRGLAAVAVVLYHVGIAAGVTQLVPFGFLAVDLFFMMSGFVLARTYEPRFGRDLRLPRFALIRIARLYPALFLGIVIAVGLAVTHGVHDTLPLQAGRSLLLVPDLSAGDLFPLNPVLWSLFYELVFNVAHGALVRWFTPKRVLVGTALFGLAFMTVIWHYQGAGVGWEGRSFLAGFARAGWGYCVGLTIARYPVQISRRAAQALLLLCVAALIAPNLGLTGVRVLLSLFFVFPSAVVGAIALQPKRGEALAHWLGGLSYPLYAIHLPILRAIAFPPFPGVVVYCVGITVGLIAAAGLVEKFYDKPIRAILKARLTIRSNGSTDAVPR